MISASGSKSQRRNMTLEGSRNLEKRRGDVDPRRSPREGAASAVSRRSLRSRTRAMAPGAWSISPAGERSRRAALYVPLAVPGTAPRGRDRLGLFWSDYPLGSEWCHLHNPGGVRCPERVQSADRSCPGVGAWPASLRSKSSRVFAPHSMSASCQWGPHRIEGFSSPLPLPSSLLLSSLLPPSLPLPLSPSIPSLSSFPPIPVSLDVLTEHSALWPARVPQLHFMGIFDFVYVQNGGVPWAAREAAHQPPGAAGRTEVAGSREGKAVISTSWGRLCH